VRRGYDLVAHRYLQWGDVAASPTRSRYLAALTERVPKDGRVLELGCGAGVPVTLALTTNYDVVGVDISRVQLELAREQAPGASFLQADTATLGFKDRSFDAALAFYTLTHVPRESHAQVLANIGRWLRPGGVLAITMGAGEAPGSIEPDWLGAPMFFSHYDAATNLRLIRAAGFEVLTAEVVAEMEDDRPVEFLWVVARVDSS